jgi:glutamate dehydrogenase (NAD(P)+)
VAIQGFGNVRSWSGHFLTELGARVVAVSDVHRGIFDGDGLDIGRLMKIVEAGGSVVEYEAGEDMGNEELLAADVDILVPAALGDVLHKWNARHVRARLVVEGANGPTRPAADAVLRERGITVVPDILANAGGVTVSYFEWVQNLQQFRWTADRVDEELGKIMTRAYDTVREVASEHDTSPRTAAFMVAVERVAAAVELRGV